MSISITYDGDYALVRGRPFVNIACHGLSSISTPYRCAAIIDTGADHLTLPDSVAALIGLNLSTYPTTTITTARGPTGARLVGGFRVDIDGQPLRITAQFLSTTPELVGLTALLSAFNFGIDPRRWLYKI